MFSAFVVVEITVYGRAEIKMFKGKCRSNANMLTGLRVRPDD